MGLKRDSRRCRLRERSCLNRTSVGLKLGPERFGATAAKTPQSNQRGIETAHPVTSSIEPTSGPQSNQRGIETIEVTDGGLGGYHGLNRTSVGLKLLGLAVAVLFAISLNRTSVGLKRLWHRYTPGPPGPPQSNQRGIETAWAFPGLPAPTPRLNRTSVGLKPSSRIRWAAGTARPQSNQRGIETWAVRRLMANSGASIEPAWD